MGSPISRGATATREDFPDPLATSTKEGALAIFRRLWAYAQKVYGLERLIGEVQDGRLRPQIPTRAVVLTALMMCLARLGSLHGMEQTRGSLRARAYLGCDLPSADTMGRVFAGLDCDSLRVILRAVYRRQRRNKALGGGRVQERWALVIDGHECTSSYWRCCSQCLQRRVQGTGGEQVQYYHRLALALLVCEQQVLLVDCELQKPGEDEVAAAVRLLERVLKDFGRAFWVIVADGLYARSDFFNLAIDSGKELIAVLKDERRDLTSDVRGLFEAMAPVMNVKGGRQRQCWDIEGLLSWPQVKRPVRVVRSLEMTCWRRQRDGQMEQRTSDWVWVTTLCQQKASTEVVIDLGHRRWAIENEGFNELVNDWYADHVYKHHPTAILGFWLLTLLAYNLFYTFILRNLKAVFRDRHTMKYWGKRVTADFIESFAPT